MIKIYNNFFETDRAAVIHNFVLNSFYKIGWDDTQEPQHRPYPNLHSEFSLEDLNKIKMLDPILKKIKKDKRHYENCVVNLTKPLDVNFIHVHQGLVALYYANNTWNPEWGGETLFYERDKKTINLANPYTPNQLVIFDGPIPHTIKAQNLIGPSYRFTISLFFKNNIKEEQK